MAIHWFKKKKKIADEKNHVETPPPGEKPSSDDLASAKGPALEGSPAAHRSPQEKPIDSSESTGFFNRLKNGLTKTRETFSNGLENIFSGKKRLDDALLEELEELLITSDVGVQTSLKLVDSISRTSVNISEPGQLKTALRNEILSLLNTSPVNSQDTISRPHIVMVIGVNGVGKTTTIGKLAAKSVTSGRKVLIAAADTFRAAAIEQLTIWADRAGADIIKHKDRTDPSAVVYDSIEAAIARNTDVVFVDTAGRLHTKVNLMEELKKIKRTIAKKVPGAPHETLLVLDATTGQNALSQAELFNNALGLTGIAVTKLDGTAKGGIVISIRNTLSIPIKYIGIGEKIDDLQDFDPEQFVNALF
jgi:fused signal recognition particle receptor